MHCCFVTVDLVKGRSYFWFCYFRSFYILCNASFPLSLWKRSSAYLFYLWGIFSLCCKCTLLILCSSCGWACLARYCLFYSFLLFIYDIHSISAHFPTDSFPSHLPARFQFLCLTVYICNYFFIIPRILPVIQSFSSLIYFRIISLADVSKAFLKFCFKFLASFNLLYLPLTPYISLQFWSFRKIWYIVLWVLLCFLQSVNVFDIASDRSDCLCSQHFNRFYNAKIHSWI